MTPGAPATEDVFGQFAAIRVMWNAIGWAHRAQEVNRRLARDSATRKTSPPTSAWK